MNPIVTKSIQHHPNHRSRLRASLDATEGTSLGIKRCDIEHRRPIALRIIMGRMGLIGHTHTVPRWWAARPRHMLDRCLVASLGFLVVSRGAMAPRQHGGPPRRLENLWKPPQTGHADSSYPFYSQPCDGGLSSPRYRGRGGVMAVPRTAFGTRPCFASGALGDLPSVPHHGFSQPISPV